ncbi:MAG: adenylate/guanylate cyclase domain-containing protein [bacterium]
MSFPSGAVTFLFTDIESSTKLSQDFPDRLEHFLEIHNAILQHAVESNHGHVFKIVGDAFCCAFGNAGDAVNAAVDVQQTLTNENHIGAEIRVRMGIDIGVVEWTGQDYAGYVTLARTNRIMSASHGGQIIISNDCYESAHAQFITGVVQNERGISFRDLGERRLKDLKEPVRLFQLTSDELASDFPPLRTLDARPNNLPFLLTNFIGREKEMKEIRILLQSSRLITLLGPGGTGKTRLSIQVGADMIDEFDHGVWIIELASINDSTLIHNSIASALNIREEAGKKLAEIITDFLKEKKILLIFDNCEHLISDCALIIQSLLSKCFGLKIFTSSREALRIQGEMSFRVPTLSMPRSNEKVTAETVICYEAVQLFTERALSVKKDFIITDENAPALAELCRHLDGIPLAIELASARIKILSVEKILENISNRFRLLTGGSRTALPRQQTLKALIDWSYDLLSENEKLLFRNLSVFTGGWSLEAAEQICSNEEIDEFEVLDLLSNLIDKSIVISNEKDGVTRYSMLETIRQYSRDILDSKDEIFRRHFEYFLKLSGESGSGDNYENKVIWKKLMESEEDNLRAALKWSWENKPDHAAGLIANVSEYWEIKGNYTEAFETLKKILELDVESDSSEMANAYLNAAFSATQLDHYETAEKYLLKGLQYFRSINNKERIANALNVYSILSYLKGEPENAKKYSEESLSLLGGLNEKLLEANVRTNLGAYYAGSGDTEAALKFVDQSIVLYREIKNEESLAKSLISKGGIYYQSGDLENAEKYFAEGLPILEEVNDQYSVITTLYNMGNLSFAQKKYSGSEEFYKAVMSKAKELGLSGLFDRSYIRLGEIALIENDNEKARKIFKECLKSFTKDSERIKISLCIYGLGKYYFFEKNYEQAAKLLLLTERIKNIIDFKFSKARAEENESIMNELKSKLPEARYDELYHETMSIEPDYAAEFALTLTDELLSREK